MQRPVRVIEAYVPGLSERPTGWYEDLQAQAAAAVRAEGLEIALLAIPNDETLIWLVWGGHDRSDPGPVVAEVILREATSAGGAAVIERAIDARFVWRAGGKTYSGRLRGRDQWSCGEWPCGEPRGTTQAAKPRRQRRQHCDPARP